MDAKYLGWRVYADSGRPYRCWKILKDADGMRAGDILHDVGPDQDPRFCLKRGDQYVDDRPADEEILERWPFSRAPRWRPPKEDLQALTDATKEVADAVKQLVQANDLRKRVRELQELVSGDSTPDAKTDGGEEKETSYLKLHKRDQYSSGDDYTIWELTRDAPEVRVSERFDVEGKPYAQEGDQLWQEEDDLTPFKLKRDGKRIASPEWWQVRHWFADVSEAPDPEEADPDLIALRRIIPNGIWRPGDLGPGGRDFDALNCTVFRAWDAIADTPIRSGDFLIKLRESKKKVDNAGEIRMPWKRLPRSIFPTIREHLDRIRPVDGSYGVQGILGKLKSYLGDTRAINAKDETSPLLLVRLVQEKVSEPIHASSEEGAIFELIASAGGRMPA